MRFLGWYNVAYGWDFDNVILLELPDYATHRQARGRRALTRHRPSGRRVDVRTPPRDVPARADGTRPGIPSLTRGATDEHATRREPPGDEPNRRRTMDGRNDLLGEIAAEAGLERADFLVQSTRAAARVPRRQQGPHPEIGGLVLIDDDPDYLSVAPDLHVPLPQPLPGRRHRRVGQRDRGHRERRGARRAVQPGRHLRRVRRGRRARPAGLPTSRPAPRTCSMAAGHRARGDGRRRRRRTRTPRPPTSGPPARRCRPSRTTTRPPRAACTTWRSTFQERSQQSEARLIEQFETAAAGLIARLGDLIILDDDDERLWFEGNGAFEAEVVPEDDEGEWQDALASARGDGRVLRPDRRLRRPGRGARRGVSGGRAGARGDEDEAPTATRPTTTAPPRTGRRRPRRGARKPSPRRRRAGGRRPRDDAARRGGARRQPRVPARAVAPVLSRALARDAAPRPASSCTSGRPTTPGLVLRRPFCINTVDRVDRDRSRSTSGSPARAPSGSRACGRAIRSRCWGRSGAAVRGRSAQPPPAAHRRRPGHGRRAVAGRRGDRATAAR